MPTIESIRSLLILGVDPGSQRTGFAGLRCRGRQLSVVDSGTIKLAREGDDLSRRLGRLQQALEEIIDRVRPDEVAVEDVFTAHNARSALALGQARGVVLAVAGRRCLPVFAYPPATVKQAVCGHGRADKRQVQHMVQVLLSLSTMPAADEADALAIAICHSLRAGTDVEADR